MTRKEIKASRDEALRKSNEQYAKDAIAFPTIVFGSAKISINDHGAAVIVSDRGRTGWNSLTIPDLVDLTSRLAGLFPEAAREGIGDTISAVSERTAESVLSKNNSDALCHALRACEYLVRERRTRERNNLVHAHWCGCAMCVATNFAQAAINVAGEE
jgi:hypothetical protein